MAVITRRQSGPIGGEEPIRLAQVIAPPVSRSASQVEEAEFDKHLKAVKLQAEPGNGGVPVNPLRTEATPSGKDNASAGAEWRSREPDLSEWLATHLGNPDNPNSARYFARVINDVKAPVRFMKGIEEPFKGVVQAIPHALAYATSASGYAPNTVSKFLDRTAENVDQNYAREEQVYQTERTNAGVQPGTFDYARAAGNALSPMTIATAKVLAPAKGASFVTRLWRSSVTGAAIMGEQPVTGGEPYRDAKLKQMGFGAVVGFGGQVVGSAIGKAANLVKGWQERQNFKWLFKAVENDVPNLRDPSVMKYLRENTIFLRPDGSRTESTSKIAAGVFGVPYKGGALPSELFRPNNPEALKHGPVWYIHSIATKAEHQGKGLASQLLNRAFNEAQRNGYRNITLEAYEDNLAARSLYTRKAFTDVSKWEEIPDGVAAWKEGAQGRPFYYMLRSAITN